MEKTFLIPRNISSRLRVKTDSNSTFFLDQRKRNQAEIFDVQPSVQTVFFKKKTSTAFAGGVRELSKRIIAKRRGIVLLLRGLLRRSPLSSHVQSPVGQAPSLPEAGAHPRRKASSACSSPQRKRKWRAAHKLLPISSLCLEGWMDGWMH